MARINLYGNTRRAIEVAKYLRAIERNHTLCIVTSPEQNGEPQYTNDLCTFICAPYMDECDVLLAVNWRKLIPMEVCAKAKFGAFCLHDSLLPKYRGCSPVVWAVEESAKETGVTMFRINEAIDAGPIIGQRRIEITDEENGYTPSVRLHSVWNRLTPLYVDLVRAHLPAILNGTITEQEQFELHAVRKRREWPK